MDDDASGRIATLGSIASGVLFAAAWNLFVGAMVRAHIDCLVWGGSWTQKHLINCTEGGNVTEVHGKDYFAPDALIQGIYVWPAILSSLGLIGLNTISFEALMEEGGAFEGGVVLIARVWIMASLILLFGGLGWALWCFITDFQTQGAWHWGGVMTLTQNLLILLAAFVFRLTRRSGDHAI